LHTVLVVYPDRILTCLFQGFAILTIITAAFIGLYYNISSFLMVHSICLYHPSSTELLLSPSISKIVNSCSYITQVRFYACTKAAC